MLPTTLRLFCQSTIHQQTYARRLIFQRGPFHIITRSLSQARRQCSSLDKINELQTEMAIAKFRLDDLKERIDAKVDTKLRADRTSSTMQIDTLQLRINGVNESLGRMETKLQTMDSEFHRTILDLEWMIVLATLPFTAVVVGAAAILYFSLDSDSSTSG